jgi:decaprenylphospho-beta-D-ribofuranose 2-oxidase
MIRTNKFDSIPAWIKYEQVTAYTESISTHSLSAYPSSLPDCKELISFAKRNGLTICPRGKGYSFADMILNDEHIVSNLIHMNQIIKWDQDTGQIVVEPGVTFTQIMIKTLSCNWMIPACPGNSEVTIGGAISNNVHGKDAWNKGNFGEHVISLKLLTSFGKVVTIHNQNDRHLFEAVVSGMGLLGIVVEATLQLEKIPSPFIETKIIPTKNLEDLNEKLENSKKDYDFTVGWVDAFSKNKSLGRGFLSVGRWADIETRLSPQLLAKSLAIPKRIYGIFPVKPAWFLLRPIFSKSFMKISNRIQYYLFEALTSIGRMKIKSKTFPEYNFMFNKLPEYPRVFRPHGFIDIQPLIPLRNGIGAIKAVFNLCHKFDFPPLMVGLKAHKSDSFMLSYAGEGYSFGCDVHLGKCNREDLKKFSREIFQHTLNCGGRVYLAKDELLPRDIFQKMFPRYKEFLKIKKELDPETLFASDMYRRLLSP